MSEPRPPRAREGAQRTALVATSFLLVSFMLEVCSLGHLAWWDAMSAALAAASRGCESLFWIERLSRLAALGSAAVLVASVAIVRGRGLPWRQIVPVLFDLGVGLLFSQLLKLILVRPRPDALPWEAIGGSFPSGHVVNAALSLGACHCLFALRPLRKHDPARILIESSSAVLVVVVAVARVYLGRHWVTDAIGSVLFAAAFWTGLRGWVSFPGVAVAALLAAMGVHVALPTPATFRARASLAPAAAGAEQGIVARAVERRGALSAKWSPPGPGFVLSAPSAVVLRILLRDERGLTGRRCELAEMRLDGVPAGSVGVGRRWQALTFAFPSMPAGWHEIEIELGRTAAGQDRVAGTFSVVRFEAEGRNGSLLPSTIGQGALPRRDVSSSVSGNG